VNTILTDAKPPEAPPEKHERLLRLASVELKCEIGRSTIYRKMAKGTFPKARRVDDGSVRWRESEIDSWIDNLPLAEDTPPE